ncbi:MAG: aminotransferase class I/II-fold pyridoxal phosphate-dependent enzyme [Clostridia bacterium]|nr:aminotransferase class I/II-fold pyridoxal phosphate-dependent enzyme [Clostridia bacterium]
MKTPIADFVKAYAKSGTARFHMPGHKGKALLGFEANDITEIAGADALFEAEGIIAESEANATALFGSRATFYSTEGSSLCIRAMLHLAVRRFREKHDAQKRPLIVAARNAHKAFLYAAAALDCDILWLRGKETDFTRCRFDFDENELKMALFSQNLPIAAVYITTPDYLGGMLDVQKIADLAHQKGIPLLVDQAHGAYLRFLPQSLHALQNGADLCCDSAHKTLPSLTGAAYLHVGKSALSSFEKEAKEAMAFYGSSSPSYLTLASLDETNKVLSSEYESELAKTVLRIGAFKKSLFQKGFSVCESDPLKITVNAAKSGYTGKDMAALLRQGGVEVEYADPDFAVLMATPSNDEADFQKAEAVFASLAQKEALAHQKPSIPKPKTICSPRAAMLASREVVRTEESLGRILATPCISCPPAVPIIVCGESIDQNAIDAFLYYGIGEISVIK